MLRKNNPAATNDDDDSFGLTALFAETAANSAADDDDYFGIAELFKENDASPQKAAQTMTVQPHIHVFRVPLNDVMFLMQHGMGMQGAIATLTLLGIGEETIIPVAAGNNVRPSIKDLVKQREVDKIASTLLARNGLFRCNKGMDHLHQVKDGSIYTGPLPKEAEPLQKKSESYGSYFSPDDSDASSELSSDLSSDSSSELEASPFFRHLV